jgi:hypothetical protein
MTEHIKKGKGTGILTLVMDRPTKKNALTDAMYRALADALEESERDPEVRVVMLRAEGDTFTAGNDIGEFAAASGSRKPGLLAELSLWTGAAASSVETAGMPSLVTLPARGTWGRPGGARPHVGAPLRDRDCPAARSVAWTCCAVATSRVTG